MNIENINNSPTRPKAKFIADIRNAAADLGYEIVDEDLTRPWGAFFRFNEKHTKDFINTFFQGYELPAWVQDQKLYPKFLLVAPNKRLSWQYHTKRGEIWNIPLGPVKVYTSQTDEQPKTPITLEQGEFSEATAGTRHRLAGSDNWGVIAEIWVHTDQKSPSDENDIIRLQDDFGREDK
jgi:mannose-6-phosphate isomerase-like protein (cupin superfamily)